MFRRNQKTDPQLVAFFAVAEKIDAAQRALLRAIPTSRDPGSPLNVALEKFEARMAEALTLMAAWQEHDSAALHDPCLRSINESLAESHALRGHEFSFEMLNARIGDVLHPLEQFVEAERQLRKPRRAGQGKRAAP